MEVSANFVKLGAITERVSVGERSRDGIGADIDSVGDCRTEFFEP
jgi:hypothetical protein